MENLAVWCKEQLKSRFGLEVSEDVAQYILAIENAQEIEEYVADLVHGSDGKKQMFTEELIEKWQKYHHAPMTGNVQTYLKKDDDTEVQKSSGEPFKKSKRKGRNKQETLAFTEQVPTTEEVKTPIDLAKAQESGSSTKKKSKFVNLYTKEGQDRLAVLIPGRHACECLAQKHKLINNCLNCGRIVCEQEGSGPCLFCGQLVCTSEEWEILQRDSNKSQKLRKKLMTDTAASGIQKDLGSELLPHQEARLKGGLEKAIKHKDKLLEFDRTSVSRTKVIDDESDYFSTDSNQWLSKQEREALRKREEELRELRHASRLERKITLDFAGRKVVEEPSELSEYYSKLDETVQMINSGGLTKQGKECVSKEQQRELVNPSILQPCPVWVDQLAPGMQRQKGGSKNDLNNERSKLRIQDRELQEISDDGWCLSMHQPWASLLVKGIKRVEGRTWYTSHRGRLWIAAAAKKPSPQEISEVETMYKMLLGRGVNFPQDYPTGCLLGCVDLIDCLSQEQYKEQYPEDCQESGSPFVFICTNPQELIVKFPMKGKHKIWKLDSKIHLGAKKGLMKQRQSA
ncbi:activating signal cointegrator 1 [Protopterus annectens]|uniref:activating signal cointegrator 1 n=1 Tax=Protopterus annectens TaxID=7888 RepID=UPI001CFA02C2|nr:activating signal cointegrator 1 [Protopterus annectens]